MIKNRDRENRERNNRRMRESERVSEIERRERKTTEE